MNIILKIIILGQTIPLRPLAQSGEGSAAGAKQRPWGASPSLPTCSSTPSTGFPSRSGLMAAPRLSHSLWRQKPNWDLRRVWRAHGRGAQGPSPACWQGQDFVVGAQKCRLLIYYSMKPLSLQSFFFFRLVQQGTPPSNLFFLQFWAVSRRRGVSSERKRAPSELAGPRAWGCALPNLAGHTLSTEMTRAAQKANSTLLMAAACQCHLNPALHRRALSPRELSSWKQHDTPSA